MDEQTRFGFELLVMALAFVAAWAAVVKAPGVRQNSALNRHALGATYGIVAGFNVVTVFGDLDLWASIVFGLLALSLIGALFPAWIHFGMSKDMPLEQKAEPSMTYVRPWRPKPNPAPVQLTRETRKRPSRNSAEPKPAKPAATKGKFGTWIFTYCDSKGEISEREVKVSSMDSEHISGYCSHGYRTFRIDHIQSEIINTSTGEILPPKDFFIFADSGVI